MRALFIGSYPNEIEPYRSVFFSLLGVELRETELCPDTKKSVTDELLQALYRFSKKHDLAHLICDALEKNGLLDGNSEVGKRFIKERNLAFFRLERLRHEYESAFKLFNQIGVNYLPLKGTVLRDLYREPWMRTSVDIDVLIHKEDLDKITTNLEQRLEYVKLSQGAYDAVMVSPSGVHLELHFNLITEQANSQASTILSDVWKHTEADGFCHKMNDEYLYYYHLAHMARHFVDGGCGVRPFIDLWLLNSCDESVKEKRDQLLEKGGLIKFAKACEKLASVWFDDKPMLDELSLFESFILNGGVFGNKANQVALHQSKSGGRFRYAMGRIFMPLAQMQYRYPVLKKHKWLYPFMVVRRLFAVIFKRDVKRIKKELQAGKKLSTSQQEQTQNLLKDLGL